MNKDIRSAIVALEELLDAQALFAKTAADQINALKEEVESLDARLLAVEQRRV